MTTRSTGADRRRRGGDGRPSYRADTGAHGGVSVAGGPGDGGDAGAGGSGVRDSVGLLGGLSQPVGGDQRQLERRHPGPPLPRLDAALAGDPSERGGLRPRPADVDDGELTGSPFCCTGGYRTAKYPFSRARSLASPLRKTSGKRSTKDSVIAQFGSIQASISTICVWTSSRDTMGGGFPRSGRAIPNMIGS